MPFLLLGVGRGVAAHVNTVLPSITGTITEGQTLTVVPGIYTGTVTSRAYQWKRGGVAIGGATATTYLLVNADVGSTITVTETPTGLGGVGASATSAATGVVLGIPESIANLAAWWSPAAGYVFADGAAKFVAASSQYLSVTDNASVSMGDVDCWFAGWMLIDSQSAERTLLGKWAAAGSGATCEYAVRYFQSPSNRFAFTVGNGTPSTATATANTFGAVPSGTWCFVLCYHDSVNNTINISVNGGAFNSTVCTTGIFDSTAMFALGRPGNYNGDYHDGRLDSVAFGKSPPGGIAGVIAAISTSLYNAGAGKTYADLTAAEKTAWGLVSFWNLNESSGNRADSHGTNTLTSNNGVTSGAGIASAQCEDGDPVSLEMDRSGNVRTASQVVLAPRPTLRVVSGSRCVRYDGVDDRLALASNLSFAGAHTFAYRVRFTTFSGSHKTPLGSVGIQASGYLHLFLSGVLYLGTTTNFIGIAHGTITAGVSYHIAVTRDAAGVVRLYKDGVLIGSQSGSTGSAVLTHLGHGYVYTDCDLGDVVAYSRDLTLAEIGQLAAM